MELASIDPDVLLSNVLRSVEVMVKSVRVTSESPNPLIPLDA